MLVQSLEGENSLEKEMATQSSILAWEIPWTEEPGALQSMGSQRVRHDSVTKQHAKCLNVFYLKTFCVSKAIYFFTFSHLLFMKSEHK